jgi:hypothetical protein
MNVRRITVVGLNLPRVASTARAWQDTNPDWTVETFTEFDKLKCINYQAMLRTVERDLDLGYSHIAAFERVATRGGIAVHWSVLPSNPLDSLLTHNVSAFVSATPDTIDPRIIGGDVNHPFWWLALTKVWNTSQHFARVDRQCGSRFLQELFDLHGPACGVVPFHSRLLTGTEVECEDACGVSYIVP